MRRSLKRHLKKLMFVLTAVSALLLAAVVVTSAAEREHTFEKKAAITQAQDNLEESAVRAAISSVVFDKSSDEVSRVAVAAQAPQEEKKEADPVEKKDNADSEDADDEDEEDWDDEDSWEEDEEEDEARSNGDFDLTYKYENYYSSDELRYLGVIYEGDFRWTWYSQNVLPGGGLDIPGRHVDENGYICDENNRICLASSDLEWGTIVTTPFGKEGCVYDCGCASGTLDVYVDF